MCWVVLGLSLLVTLTSACAKGDTELGVWRALNPGMELYRESGAGPHGEDAFGLLYTIVPGRDYAVERPWSMSEQGDIADLYLLATTTRVLYLSVVLVDETGQEYESALTLLPNGWRELRFSTYQPALTVSTQIAKLRLVDRTGGLGGQGVVSLKLVGLPF
jgi:hypothetical protein